jgi:hypothetical protein
MHVGEVVVASVILEFTIQHFLTDGEHGEYRVAEEAATGRNPIRLSWNRTRSRSAAPMFFMEACATPRA